MENYIMSDETRSALLKYLYTSPYQEVAQAIAVLMKLPKLDPKINPNFVKDEGNKSKTK